MTNIGFHLTDTNQHNRTAFWLIPVILSILLLAVSQYNYLLFHTLAEFFAIIVALLFSIVAWQMYPFTKNNFLMYLGCGYFWIAVLDLLHTFTYSGMSIFPDSKLDIAIQYWVGTRYLEAFLLLSSPLFFTRTLNRPMAFSLFGLIAISLSALVITDTFPDTFIKGKGLTDFKVYSEYAIIGLLIGAIIFLRSKQHHIDRYIMNIMTAAIALTMAAEMAFTFYVDLYGLSNLFGHILKLWSFWLIYIAVVKTTLNDPFMAMARGSYSYDAIPDATIIVDDEGVIRQANKAAGLLAGRDHIELIGRDNHEVFHPANIDPESCPACQACQAAMKNKAYEVIELGNNQYCLEISISPVTGISELRGSVQVLHDVTDKKESTKLTSEYTAILEHSVNEIYIFDQTTLKFTQASKGAIDNLGYSMEEMKSITPVDVKPEYTEEAFRKLLLPMLDGETDRLVFETRHERKDGTTYPVEVHVQLVPVSGQQSQFMAVILDITQRKQFEHELVRQSAEFEAVFNSIADAVVFADTERHIVATNQATYDMFGYTNEELLGKTTKILYANESDYMGQGNQRYHVGAESDPVPYEVNYRRKDGSCFIGETLGTPVKDNQGNVAGFIGVIRDITERKKIDEQVRNLAQAVEQSPESIVITNIDAEIEYVNNSFLQITGYDNDEVIGQNPRILHSGNTPPETYVTMWDALTHGQIWRGEFYNKRKDGTEYTEHAIISPIHQPDGSITHYLAVKEDITERKKMQDEILSSAQHLRLYQEQTPLAAIEWNVDFEVVDWNAAAEKMFGYTLDEVKGRYFVDFMLPESAVVDVKQIWKDLIAQTGGTKSINENLTRDGQIILCEWHNTPLRDESGKVIGAASIVLDITAEQQAKQALLRKEQEQREILDSMVDAVITIDETGKILTFNKASETLFGYTFDEMIGQNVYPLMPMPFASKYNDYLKHYLKTGESHILDSSRKVEGQRKNKGTFPMRLSVAELPIGEDGKRRFIGSCLDLTQLKQQERLLRHSQKMDSLGKLTGGIAHDFNNLLGVILGYADLLESLLSDQPKPAGYVGKIHHAGERGAKLTQKLLAFSRQKASDEEVLNINTLLRDEQHMLERTLTARIQLELDLTNDLWQVRIDSGDLEDAIVNLSINAMHAIEGNGQLTIQTANERINSSDAQPLDLAPGDYVVLNITDTGCGMDETTKENIFDPFYTTKGSEGTGLGLSQVYGFIERSGGVITVYSEPDHGTQFALYFPRYHENAGKDESTEIDIAADLRGTETILTVDDEPALLDLTTEILGPLGYTVLRAENGAQALEILENESIDLLLSDIIMPNMDGYQLAAIVQEQYPGVKIQLTSGFTDERHVDIVDDKLHQNLLHKPYRSQTLVKKVRNLLDEVTD